MKKVIFVILCNFCFFVFGAFGHSLCGYSVGKEVKSVRPKRPSNLTGTVEVKVIIDENGSVFSASSLFTDKKLREVALTAALRTRFYPSAIGQNVISQANITYNFTGEKMKADVSFVIKIAEEYDELLESKINCGSLQNDISEFITQDIKKNINGQSFSIKKEEVIIVPQNSTAKTIEKLKGLNSKIISDDINYFGGIYSEVPVDKILQVLKLGEVTDLFSLGSLDVCDYRLFRYDKQKRLECTSLKSVGSQSVIFYGNLTGKLINLPENISQDNINDFNGEGRIFVQVKFDAKGNILEAKAVSGNSSLFPVAEKAALRAKLLPSSVDRDSNFAIGFIILKAADFQKE